MYKLLLNVNISLILDIDIYFGFFGYILGFGCYGYILDVMDVFGFEYIISFSGF